MTSSTLEGDLRVASLDVNASTKSKFKTAANATAAVHNTRFKAAAASAINNTNAHRDEKRDDVHSADDNWGKMYTGAKIAAASAKKLRSAANEKLFNRTVVSANTWDVWTPPPGNTLSGKVVPRLMNKHKHRRKCSLEIHKVTPLADSPDDTGTATNSQEKQHFYYECVVRILVPATRELSRKVKMEAMKNMTNRGTATATASSADAFTSASEIRFDETDFDHDGDDGTVDSGASSSSSSSSSQKNHLLKDHGGKEYHGWKPLYCLPMHGIYIQGSYKKTVSIVIKISHFKQERDLIFDAGDDARSFVKHIEKQKRLETDRQEGRLKVALGDDIVLPKYETIELLFEIVSGYNLPVGDFTTSDPYVCVFMGHQEIHRTDYRPKTLNPIWNLRTKSLFILKVESRRFFIEEGVKFVVKDHDKIGKHEVLGTCKVDPKVLYKANGERMTFNLAHPRVPYAGSKYGTDKFANGVLVIRCRRATSYDKQFMADFAKHKQSNKGADGVSSYNAPESDTGIFKTLTTKVKKRDAKGDLLYKVRPFSDPMQSSDESEWISNANLQEAVLTPSRQWVDIGEGSLGKIHLEILGCDDLPNLDSGGFYGNKTDTFVACVYEDVYGRTDVIDDCLSPRWLPWCNRAFILNMAHPSSFLNLGIFDFDSGGDLIADHDLIGRVSVDLTNFRSGTEYVLSYNICPSAQVSNRKSSGKLIIRLRMDIPDERQLAMTSLYPPAPIYVNTMSRKDFAVIKKTCNGDVDVEQYSVPTLKSYIDELYDLKLSLFYLQDGLTALFLWRSCSEWRIPLVGIKVNLPFHSIVAFAMTTFLVEHPTFLPSFCFGSLAWLLLAIGGWRQESENVWWRCHSYVQIFKMIALGDDFAEPHKIKPFENFEKANIETEEWVKRIKESEKRATREAEEANNLELERQRELAEIGELNNDHSTKVNQSTINPVRSALYPIQLMLGILVRFIRVVKNVLLWQEAYLTFWITTGSLVLAIVSLFVPWLWCLKWGSRIIVWTIFGPWMKLVDIYYVSLLEPETEEQIERRKKAEILAQKIIYSETVNQARILQENSSKLKAMKRYMFGKYALRIPVLKMDRFPDIPLAESFATPYREKNYSLGGLAMQEAGYHIKRIPGQTLIGDMIPYVREEEFTLAPTGKATLHTEKLKAGPKGRAVTNPIMIVLAVALAVGITYFGTPLVASVLAETDDWISALVAQKEQEL